jgi:hypothetical protein
MTYGPTRQNAFAPVPDPILGAAILDEFNQPPALLGLALAGLGCDLRKPH